MDRLRFDEFTVKETERKPKTMKAQKLLSLLLAVAIMAACFSCVTLCKATSSDYMYHITATGNNVKPLQKTANLVKGHTYTTKFK